MAADKPCHIKVRARSSAVEHLTFNQVVVGSIPTGLTIECPTKIPKIDAR